MEFAKSSHKFPRTSSKNQYFALISKNIQNFFRLFMLFPKKVSWTSTILTIFNDFPKYHTVAFLAQAIYFHRLSHSFTDCAQSCLLMLARRLRSNNTCWNSILGWIIQMIHNQPLMQNSMHWVVLRGRDHAFHGITRIAKCICHPYQCLCVWVHM